MRPARVAGVAFRPRQPASSRACRRSTPPFPVPAGGSWLRRLLAFSGPGYMVSVGYMDPGNWATDLAGGSKFGYTLLSVIMLSNLMAILLQALAARLGIATGRDLAQACRDAYPRPVGFALWIACELAIIACDLAEVIGTAIALKLLFGIPLIGGALITALDAFLLLLLMNTGLPLPRSLHHRAADRDRGLLRWSRSCWRRRRSRPCSAASCRRREIVTNPEMLYIAIGILGATVMPHNLYLHSSIVQTRRFEHERRRPPPRHPLGHHRQHHRADAGAVRQRRDPHRRRRGVPSPTARPTSPRSSRPMRCCRRCSASASPRCCSRWRCWPRASTRR